MRVIWRRCVGNWISICGKSRTVWGSRFTTAVTPLNCGAANLAAKWALRCSPHSTPTLPMAVSSVPIVFTFGYRTPTWKCSARRRRRMPILRRPVSSVRNGSPCDREARISALTWRQSTITTLTLASVRLERVKPTLRSLALCERSSTKR